MTGRKGFTLIELMVVILIVGILAAASIPLMRGRIDSAKWAEANATAGTIKSAVRVYFAERGAAITGSLGVAATQTALGFTASDLTGTYFIPSNYNIDSVDANGNIDSPDGCRHCPPYFIGERASVRIAEDHPGRPGVRRQCQSFNRITGIPFKSIEVMLGVEEDFHAFVF